MKKNPILTFLFLSSISTFVQAQANHTHTNLPIDSRLYEVFDSLYLENVKTGNPFLIQRMNFYLDHSWYVTAVPPQKIKPDVPSVRIGDVNKLNIFALERAQHVLRDWNQITIYKIVNSDKVLVLRSGKECTELLNEYLKRQ